MLASLPPTPSIHREIVALSRSTSRLPVIVALLVITGACSGSTRAEGVAETSSTAAQANSTSPSAQVPGATIETATVAVVPPGGVDLRAGPGGEVHYRAAENLAFPILVDDGEWLQVLTTCNTEEWLLGSEVELFGNANPGQPGPGFDLSQAVLVVDPGHGGRDLGAKGATGSNESDVNLAIATLLRDRLVAPQDIDWTTGHVKPGGQYPAVAAVWMTRGPESPDSGDIELGLAYRAEMANGVGADALLSIHNNSLPDRALSAPGSDVFYAVSSPGSDRLASLIHQEMVEGLSPFSASWTGAVVSGPQARLDAETGEDLYGLLRRSVAPTVIVEGLYISEPTEEILLQSPLVQQAYADSIYRGLVRFLTTDDWGTPPIDPISFAGTVGTPSTSSCVVPTQP